MVFVFSAYSPETNLETVNVVQAGAFRFGHSQVPNNIHIVDKTFAHATTMSLAAVSSLKTRELAYCQLCFYRQWRKVGIVITLFLCFPSHFSVHIHWQLTPKNYHDAKFVDWWYYNNFRWCQWRMRWHYSIFCFQCQFSTVAMTSTLLSSLVIVIKKFRCQQSRPHSTHCGLVTMYGDINLGRHWLG